MTEADGGCSPSTHLQGVQFVFVKKAGLGVGFASGVGFSLAKLGAGADGAAQWSAPCFLGEKSLAIGALVGGCSTTLISFAPGA